MSDSTPAGWYPDGQGGQRWWDGNQWTEHTLPPPDTSDRPAAPEPPAQPGPSDVTQVRRPDSPADQGPPAGDRPAAPEPGQPPAAMPTQVAGGGPGQAGYPGQQPGQPGHPGQQPGHPGAPQQGYPGQPGQPAWQGQHGGGSSGGRGKLIGIIGGAAAVVIVLAIVLFLVLRGGGGPGGAVEDYFEAIQDQDCAFIDQMTENSQEGVDKEECEDDPEAFFGEETTCPDSEIEVKDEEEDGDKATVEYEVTGGGEDCEEEGTITLVKEDGDWKIDGFE